MPETKVSVAEMVAAIRACDLNPSMRAIIIRDLLTAEQRTKYQRARIVILAEGWAAHNKPLPSDAEIDKRIHDLNIEEEQNHIWVNEEIATLQREYAEMRAVFAQVRDDLWDTRGKIGCTCVPGSYDCPLHILLASINSIDEMGLAPKEAVNG